MEDDTAAPADEFRLRKFNKTVRYEIDKKLLQTVQRIGDNGYKNETLNVIQWLKKKGIPLSDRPRMEQALSEKLLVKEDKPNYCYTYHIMLDNLREKTADDVTVAIRGKPDNLAASGFDLVYNLDTRFNCIHSFRQAITEIEEKQPGYIDIIKEHPLILMNPCKPANNETKYKYLLNKCPKNPNRKNDARKKTKFERNLTTNQGMPIFSTYNVHKHYLNSR